MLYFEASGQQARCSLNLISSLRLETYDVLQRVGIHRVIGSPTTRKQRHRNAEPTETHRSFEGHQTKKEAKGGARVIQRGECRLVRRLREVLKRWIPNNIRYPPKPDRKNNNRKKQNHENESIQTAEALQA